MSQQIDGFSGDEDTPVEAPPSPAYDTIIVNGKPRRIARDDRQAGGLPYRVVGAVFDAAREIRRRDSGRD